VLVPYAWSSMDGNPRVLEMAEPLRKKVELGMFLDKTEAGGRQCVGVPDAWS